MDQLECNASALDLLRCDGQTQLLLQGDRDHAAQRMRLPRRHHDDLGNRCPLGPLEHGDDLRLFGASADGDGFRGVNRPGLTGEFVVQ